ncbi:MAG: hypothetical protein HYT80_05830 [Euryarchaeota archaeon]|nr:hypothetical protein [Euryarchaeota archaeon]
MPTNLDYLALAIVLSAGLFLYFLVRFVLEVVTVAVYARFLREIKGWERRQAQLEAERRFYPGRP